MTNSRQRETEQAKLLRAFQYDPPIYMESDNDFIYLSRQHMKNYKDIRISSITTGPYFLEFLSESQKFFTVSTRLYLKHIFVTFFIRDEQEDQAIRKQTHTLNLGQFILRCPGVLDILKSYMDGRPDSVHLMNFLQWLMGQYPEEWTRHYKPTELYQQKILDQDSLDVYTYWLSPFAERDLLIFEDIYDTDYNIEDIDQVNEFTEACKIYEKNPLIQNIYQAKLSRDPNCLNQEQKSNMQRLEGMWHLKQDSFLPKKIIFQQYEIAKNKVKSEIFSPQQNITENISSHSSSLQNQSNLPDRSATLRGELLPTSKQGKDRELSEGTHQSATVQSSNTTLLPSSNQTPMPTQAAFTSTTQGNMLGIFNRERHQHNKMQNALTTIISTPYQSSNQPFLTSSKRVLSIAQPNIQSEEVKQDLQRNQPKGLAGSTFVKNHQSNQTEMFPNVDEMANQIHSRDSEESPSQSRAESQQNQNIPAQSHQMHSGAGQGQLRESAQLEVINQYTNEESEDQLMDDQSQNVLIQGSSEFKTEEVDYVEPTSDKEDSPSDSQSSEQYDDEEDAEMDYEEDKQVQQSLNDEAMTDEQVDAQQTDDDVQIVDEYQDPFRYDRYRNSHQRTDSMHNKCALVTNLQKEKGPLFTAKVLAAYFPRLSIKEGDNIELDTLFVKLDESLDYIYDDQMKAAKSSDPFLYDCKRAYIPRVVSAFKDSPLVRQYDSEIIDTFRDMVDEAKSLRAKYNPKDKSYVKSFKIALDVQGLLRKFKIHIAVDQIIERDLELIIKKAKMDSFYEYLPELNIEVVKEYFKQLRYFRESLTKQTSIEVISDPAQNKAQTVDDDSTKDEEMDDRTDQQNPSRRLAQSQVNSRLGSNILTRMSDKQREKISHGYVLILLNFIRFAIIQNTAKSLLSMIYSKAFYAIQAYNKSPQLRRAQIRDGFDGSNQSNEGAQEQLPKRKGQSIKQMLETQAKLAQDQTITGPGQAQVFQKQQYQLQQSELDLQQNQGINISSALTQPQRAGKTGFNKPGTPMKNQFHSSALAQSIQKLNQPNQTQQTQGNEHVMSALLQFNPKLRHQSTQSQSMIQQKQSSASNLNTSNKAGKQQSQQQINIEQQPKLPSEGKEEAKQASSANDSILKEINMLELDKSKHRYEEIEKAIINKIESQLKHHNLVKNIEAYRHATQFPLLRISEFSFYEIFVERILEVTKLMDSYTGEKPQMPRGLLGNSRISSSLVKVIKYHKTAGKQYTDTVSLPVPANSIFPKLTPLSGKDHYTEETKGFKRDIDEVMWLYNQLMGAELYISREVFVMLSTLRYDANIPASRIFNALKESLDEFDPYSIEHTSPYFLYDKKTLEPLFLQKVHSQYNNGLSVDLAEFTQEVTHKQRLLELMKDCNDQLIVEVFFTVPKEYHGRVYFIAKLDSCGQMRIVSSQQEERNTVVVKGGEQAKRNIFLKSCELRPSNSEPQLFAVRYYKLESYQSVLNTKRLESRSLPQRLKLRNMLMLFFHYIQPVNLNAALSLMKVLGLAGIFSYLKTINVQPNFPEADWITRNDSVDTMSRDFTYRYQYEQKTPSLEKLLVQYDRGQVFAFFMNSYSLNALDSIAVTNTLDEAKAVVKEFSDGFMSIPGLLKISKYSQTVLKLYNFSMNQLSSKMIENLTLIIKNFVKQYRLSELGQYESIRPTEQKVDEEMGSQDDEFADEEYFTKDAQPKRRAGSEIARDQDHTESSADQSESLNILDVSQSSQFIDSIQNLQFKPYNVFTNQSVQIMKRIEQEFYKRSDPDKTSLRFLFEQDTNQKVSYFRFFQPSIYQDLLPQDLSGNKINQEEVKQGHNYQQTQIQGYLGSGTQAKAKQAPSIVQPNKLDISTQNPNKPGVKGKSRDNSIDSIKKVSGAKRKRSDQPN